ncbi:MAG: ribonuclease HII [Chloroflexi bacterium]|nr:ribonuclease HII [Chloroflexota bacterium]
MQTIPDFSNERFLWQQGYNYIAGVDEVGRGPLAGPIMAAAVILPKDANFAWLSDVKDSKLLSEKKREHLYSLILREALAAGIGSVNSSDIDRIGIGTADKVAMRLAVDNLCHPTDFLLIDAFLIPDVDIPQKGIIHGDRLCISIAAASIVAKVTRDHFMMGYDCVYSQYGFAHHKGYATREHIANLHKYGPCPIHRRSFAPISGFSK